MSLPPPCRPIRGREEGGTHRGSRGWLQNSKGDRKLIIFFSFQGIFADFLSCFWLLERVLLAFLEVPQRISKVPTVGLERVSQCVLGYLQQVLEGTHRVFNVW